MREAAKHANADPSNYLAYDPNSAQSTANNSLTTTVATQKGAADSYAYSLSTVQLYQSLFTVTF